MIESDTMVWLHAFKKKTQKTPASDLELAEKRMREVLGL
jgi:phage-related protein